MYGVLGEDKSDVSTLKVLIRRLAGNESLTIHGKGFDGCAQLMRKGAVHLSMFARKPINCQKFVVCYDADGQDPTARRNEVVSKVFAASGIDAKCCAVIPVQELEAWILADLSAVSKVIKSWAPTENFPNPEMQASPKELLERLSRDSRRIPRYSHAVHNEKVARFLDLKRLEDRCPSFRPLKEFVVYGVSNCGAR